MTRVFRLASARLDAAGAGTMDFPTIVGALIAAGFEGYDVEYRRWTSTYFRADGDSVQLVKPTLRAPVAATFDAIQIGHAVHAAQSKEAGYTYAGSNARVQAARCAGSRSRFSQKNGSSQESVQVIN